MASQSGYYCRFFWQSGKYAYRNAVASYAYFHDAFLGKLQLHLYAVGRIKVLELS